MCIYLLIDYILQNKDFCVMERFSYEWYMFDICAILIEHITSALF